MQNDTEGNDAKAEAIESYQSFGGLLLFLCSWIEATELLGEWLRLASRGRRLRVFQDSDTGLRGSKPLYAFPLLHPPDSNPPPLIGSWLLNFPVQRRPPTDARLAILGYSVLAKKALTTQLADFQLTLAVNFCQVQAWKRAHCFTLMQLYSITKSLQCACLPSMSSHFVLSN